MKKLVVLLLVLLLCISLCGCGVSTTEPDKISTSPNSSASTNNASETLRITEEEAIEIASKYQGIKSGDKDENTGFSFLIMPVESQNDNIKIALKWFVDNQHYSTVDMIEIDPYTGKIANTD